MKNSCLVVFFLAGFTVFLVSNPQVKWPKPSEIGSYADNLPKQSKIPATTTSSIKFSTTSTQISTKTAAIETTPSFITTSTTRIQPDTNKTSSFIPITPPYNLPAEIRLNPDLEALFCANGTFDCVDFHEVSQIPSKLSYINYQTYSKVINDLNKHTNPYNSKYTFFENTTHIKLEIFPKDSKSVRKLYLGDYWIARVVPKNQSIGYFAKHDSDVKFNTLIPLKIKEILTDEKAPFYRSSISKNHPLFNKLKHQNYTLQVFFIRSSEMASLHRRVQSKINASNRMWYAEFEKADGVFECSPLAPFLLTGFFRENRTCALSSEPGREFYCDNVLPNVCKNDKLLRVGYKQSDNHGVNHGTVLGELLKGFDPDRFYENLVFEKCFTVEDFEKNKVSKSNFESYWENSIYRDPNVPDMTSVDCRRKVLENKIIVSVGDSINYQLIKLMIGDTGDHCEHTTWSFLGLNSDEKLCANVHEYAPSKWFCPKINTTFHHVWHGNPLHNPFKGHKKFSCPLIQHNAGEILDRMIEYGWFGEEYVVFTDVGVHLAIFNPIVVYRRLVDFRNSAERYLKAHGDVGQSRFAKIVYKGMLYNRGDLKEVYSTVSSTIMKRIQEIAEYVFRDSCVKVFDFWTTDWFF